ncbi:MAG: SHOCT domain-containing protein [Bacilli bacterium]|nr:SHOCT domain-containing protein [Bacilli bacterium]
MDLAKGKADAPNGDVVAEASEAKESDLEKLERLAKLHESGALSDEEFQLAKDKILK